MVSPLSHDVPLMPWPVLLQVAVWLRLSILLPLLPIVYGDREPDPKKNLRRWGRRQGGQAGEVGRVGGGTGGGVGVGQAGE